jgi:hypothetical protein
MQGDADRATNAAKIVVGEGQAQRGPVFSHFLLKAFVRLVSLLICIRIVRFWRSTIDVQTRYPALDRNRK